jgi:SAM-dependent methyltransferase
LTDPANGPGAEPDGAEIQRRYRWRIAAFLVAACVTLALLTAACWTSEAIRHVGVVEVERDRWQRPRDVVHALELQDGAVVADLGSGVGYFALKLSDRVGKRGRVLAVDVRRFPLLFLRARALLSGRHNVEVVHGAVDGPRLPAGGIDAVLVANTYHELTHPGAVLDRLLEALRPGGRLVLVDPGPETLHGEPGELETHRHETAASAEDRLRAAGFEILSRQDAFIEGEGHGSWWLIVARRPRAGGTH